MKAVTQREFTMLEEQRRQANQELAIYGYQLTKDDMRHLYQVLTKVCKRYAMIETDVAILFRFIHAFQDGRYAKNAEFIRLLEAVMDVYYALRSHYPIRISDMNLLDIMRVMYEKNHGRMDHTTRRLVMLALQKEMNYECVDEE